MNVSFEVIYYQGKPFGVVVSTPEGVGFSLCNREAGDRWSLDRGVEIALGRAQKLNNGKRMSVWDKLDGFVERAQRKGNLVLAEKLIHYVWPALQKAQSFCAVKVAT